MIVTEELCRKALKMGISLSAGTSLAGQITFENGIRIYSGSLSNVTLGAYSYIVSGTVTTLSVGRYCSIAHGVEFGFYTHPTDWLTTHPFTFNPYMPDPLQWPVPLCTDPSPKPIIIGHDVWIGAHVKVMGGVVIGNGAIIAAGSIVTKDVEPYTIVGGVPAKPIRMRFDPETIAELTALQWWNYDWPTMLKEGKEGNIEWNNPHKAIASIKSYSDKGMLNSYRLKKKLSPFHEEPGCRVLVST